GVQQVHAREPAAVAPEHAAAEPHRRNPRYVRAVGEGRAHDVELVLDAERAAPQRRDVVLALPFHAAEDRVALRVARLLQLERAGRIAGGDARGLVAGIAGEAPEDEAVEPRVVAGQLETKRPDGAAQSGFDRLRDLDREIGTADVERPG